MANVGTASAGKTLIGTGNLSSPTFAALGTLSGLTDHGVVIAKGVAAFTVVAPGSTGQVLTAVTGGDPIWAAAGAGTVTSVSGTTNRITSTGGATPVIDISANYVGQTSLTTLGTVTTGTWTATAIDATHGGTAQTSWATGDLLYASGANTLSKLAAGTNTNVLTLVGGVPAWVVPATGVTWTNITGTTQSMSSNSGYFSNNAGAVAFTLPTTAALFEYVEIVGIQGSWNIVQGVGQSIAFGNVTTTVGAGGLLSSTVATDNVKLQCIVANTKWQVVRSFGNITYV